MFLFLSIAMLGLRCAKESASSHMPLAPSIGRGGGETPLVNYKLEAYVSRKTT